MAGPLFIASGTLVATGAGVSLAPPLPTGIVAHGGAHLACVCSKNNAVHSTATPGWSKFAQTNSGANFTVSLWIAAENAAAPTFTWSGSVAGHAQIAYYADPSNAVATIISISGTTGVGSASPHTSTGFNTDVADALAVYIDACAINTALTTPAGWTSNVSTGSATSATRQQFGSKAIATSGSASGNISTVGGVAEWVQFQIELRGQIATAGLETSKVTLAAWEEPADGFGASKVTLAAWLQADDVRFSKAELDAWLETDDVRFSKAELDAWLETADVRFAKVDLYAWLEGPPTGGGSGGGRRMSLM